MQFKLSSSDWLLGVQTPVSLGVEAVFVSCLWLMLMGGCRSLFGSVTNICQLVIACEEIFLPKSSEVERLHCSWPLCCDHSAVTNPVHSFLRVIQSSRCRPLGHLRVTVFRGVTSLFLHEFYTWPPQATTHEVCIQCLYYGYIKTNWFKHYLLIIIEINIKRKDVTQQKHLHIPFVPAAPELFFVAMGSSATHKKIYMSCTWSTKAENIHPSCASL